MSRGDVEFFEVATKIVESPFTIMPEEALLSAIWRQKKSSISFLLIAKAKQNGFVDEFQLFFAAVFHGVVNYRASILFVKRAQCNKVAVTSYRRMDIAGISSYWVSVEKSHKIISRASWVVGVFISSTITAFKRVSNIFSDERSRFLKNLPELPKGL